MTENVEPTPYINRAGEEIPMETAPVDSLSLDAMTDREMLEQIYTSLTILVEDVNALRVEADSVKGLITTVTPIMDIVLKEVETKGIMGLMPLITGSIFKR